MFKVHKSKILGLICIVWIHHINPVIMRVDTEIVGKNKVVTYLSDDHVQVPEEQDQLNGILSFLQQREKTNDSTHFLIEQPSWLADIFGCGSQVLFHLPKYIEQATPHLTLTTFENLEMRHLANAACNILTFPVPYQLNPYKKQKIDTMQKALGQITFQDVLDDFVQIKELLATYFLQQGDSVMADIYATHIKRADKYYETFLQQMKKDEISPDTFVLKYAKKNCLTKKEPLAVAILDTFSSFFDLHATHKILTSEHKNLVMVAGSWHTQRTRDALQNFNVSSLYSAGKTVSINQKPITPAQIQQSLSMQKQSLMSMYAPTVIKGSMGIFLCYLLCLTIMQTII